MVTHNHRDGFTAFQSPIHFSHQGSQRRNRPAPSTIPILSKMTSSYKLSTLQYGLKDLAQEWDYNYRPGSLNCLDLPSFR